MLMKKMFSAESPAHSGQADILNPGSCVKARQSPSEGGSSRRLVSAKLRAVAGSAVPKPERKSTMFKQMITFAAVAGLVLALAPAAQAAMETVHVGNAGNAADTETGYGAVAYTYNIGKYEVTAGQYCDFLNAVDPTGANALDLYNTSMNSNNDYGCQITWNAGSTTYDFSGAPDPKTSWTYVNGPVNYVSFYDALRFANWLHNGRGSGDTEDGAYDMTKSGADLVRKDGWQWAVTSEDEWYKAAYYSGGPLSTDYYDNPTESDNPPTAKTPAAQDATAPGSANYNSVMPADYGHPVDVGLYVAEDGGDYVSDGPYGTFDQAGNVWEWNEAIIGSDRGVRGGSFCHSGGLLASNRDGYYYSAGEGSSVGFRVSEVPEPATMAILALGGIGILRRRKCVQR